jgi:hypothetical protein
MKEFLWVQDGPMLRLSGQGIGNPLPVADISQQSDHRTRMTVSVSRLMDVPGTDLVDREELLPFSSNQYFACHLPVNLCPRTLSTCRQLPYGCLILKGQRHSIKSIIVGSKLIKYAHLPSYFSGKRDRALGSVAYQ